LSFNMGWRILVFYPEPEASVIYFDSDMSKSTNTVVGLLHNVFIVNHIFPRRLLKWLRSRKVSCSFMTHTWWKYNFFHMHPSWRVKRLIIYIKNRTRCLHHLNRFILQSVNNKFQSDDKITWRQNGFQKILHGFWIINMYIQSKLFHQF
jgi:hypothetical protein